MTFRVRFTRHAQGDLQRLFDFILEREAARPGGGDFKLAESALAAIHSGMETLKNSPFTCRKAINSPFLRELVISFGHSGYVALFEIADASTIDVLAIRHQLEDDYH